MRSSPSVLAVAAIIATTVAGAGCGGASHELHATPPGTSTTAVKHRVEHLEHEVSLRALTDAPNDSRGNGAAETAARSHPPQTTRTVSSHPSLPPPRRPYAAGPLTATYRTTLRGGDALAPPGPYPRASARVVVRIYGRTETCWTFRHLHGVKGPRLAGLALGANAHQGLITFFTTTFATRGCETGIPSSTLRAVERQPHNFSVLIEDHNYTPSLVGEL